MSHLSRTGAIALAAALLAPVPALAGGLDLKGAPTLRQTGEHTARVAFAVEDRIDRDRRATVTFSDQGRFAASPDGRHGTDYRYAARVRSERSLRAGARYQVRITVPGSGSVTRELKLIRVP